MKSLSISIAIFLVLSSNVVCSEEKPNNEDPFAELDTEINSLNNEGSPSEDIIFKDWLDKHLIEYQNFRKEHFKRVDDVRDELISLWGESDSSSRSKYVEYSKDKKTKTTLDYEKNEITVSVLHDKDKKVSQKFIIDSLNNMADSSSSKTSLSQIVGQPLTNSSTETLVKMAKINHKPTALIKNKKALIAKEIILIQKQSQAQLSQVEKMYDLVNSIKTPDTEDMAEETAEKMAKETENKIEKEKVQIEKETKERISSLHKQTAKLNKSKKRNALQNKKITTYTMPLGNKKDLTKAKPYISNVKSQSERWELSPSLLLAIMHTESYFNPRAQSHVPAFGLMQIVPRSAGVDVNRFLYQNDKPMTESYLFQSDKNIETGVAYVHILNSRYLKKISNPESRMYCMIAAYNTGSGNVAKTFNKDGSRNINRAARIINKLSAKEVYDHLVTNLPYDETRNYLKRVTKRRKIYTAIDKI